MYFSSERHTHIVSRMKPCDKNLFFDKLIDVFEHLHHDSESINEYKNAFFEMTDLGLRFKKQ